MKIKKISVIGLGYVGLPLLCAIARSRKYEAVGFDINKEKIKKIRERKCPIDDEVCAEDIKELDLKVSSEERMIKNSDVFIICVPTPVLDDYTPDYTPVKEASKTAAKYLRPSNIVVVESTINPGTCEEIVAPVIEEVSKLKVGKDITLAHCPERINPGDPKWNVYNIARNIGVYPGKDTKKVADFYRDFIKADINEVSSLKVAEATKIVENTFRDINIAYVNELAMSFDAMGIDLIETLQGASNKPFAFMIHWPGRGVGGHCIAVDPYYLINRAAKSGFNHSFLKMARDVNNNMPKYAVSRLQEALNMAKMPINGTKVALLGLSYKANVGDLRESPCLEIQKRLTSLGAKLVVYDPYFAELSTVKSLKEALRKSEAVFLCTPHNEFLVLDEVLGEYKKIKVLVDGMNGLNKRKVEKLGIIYRGIGR
ncbi:nucleotide sugar dehydrogenase [Candidatus Dojkabacteria bacterium]|nr:nucleotide sugar dehydrogenase [Candidatus Dojkabacteria bacterium]